jgi:arginyl-tRNA synthetase
MFLDFRAEVETALADALDALGYPTDDLGLERPPADVDAALASSVAFRLAGDAGEPPPAVAAELADAVDSSDCAYLGAATAQGPYVNFRPSERYVEETVAAAQTPTYGHLEAREQRVVVEHTSANPTGPVHVGRARNPIIGDAIARLLEYAGSDVERQYYVNDAGRQIATFTWAYETFDESDLSEPDPERDKPDYDLVRYYRHGTSYLETASEDEREAAEAEIEALMGALEAGEEAAYERVSRVVDTVLEGMQESLERLPVTFDEFVKETRFMRDGSTDDVIDRLQSLDAAVYEDDAWQLTFEDIEKNLVFERSDGTSLYTTRDVAYHEWKLSEFDRVVTVLGEDHGLEARQLRATLEALSVDTDPIDQVFYSWVTLPDGGGMSTREGTGVDLDELLDEALDRARAEVEARLGDRLRSGELSEADIDRIARQVGIGAVRYDIVAKQPEKSITFDFERALDFEAQSAPYVQYVHARAAGILAEADHEPADSVAAAALETPEERDLVRTIGRFPAVIESAAEELQPHVVATYTREFAEQFNAFYRECPVLEADPETSRARLALVAAAKTTIANALDVLGIESPESM